MNNLKIKNNNQSTIDFKQVLLKYTNYWHWFLISIIISLTVVFFYLRYADKIYESKSVIKILDNSSSDLKMPTNISTLFRSKINLENEIEIISSYRILQKVSENLKLNTSYYVSGLVKESEVWLDKPVKINWIGEKDRVDDYSVNWEFNIKKNGYFLNGDKKIKNYNQVYNVGGISFSLNLNNSFGNQNKIIRIIKVKEKYSVDLLKNKLKVARVGEESELLQISINGACKEKNDDILNALNQVFNQDGVEDRQKVYKKTLDFVADRFNFLFSELDSIENNKARYKKKEQLSFLESDAFSLLDTKTKTNSSLVETQLQLELTRIMFDALRKVKQNELLPANIGIIQLDINSLINEYNQVVLLTQKTQKEAGYKDPQIINLIDSQKKLKDNINASLVSYEKLLSSEMKSIESIKSSQANQYAALPFQEKAIRSIDRQQQIKENLYLFLLQKREEAAVNLAITSPTIKIVDNAISTDKEISPKKALFVLISFLIGFLVPFICIYLYYLFDSKVQTKKDIESVINNVSVIAEIPYISEINKLIKFEDRSVLSEAFRILRTNLSFLLPNKDKSNVIFVTSTVKGEGKTFVSINLAVTLSSLGKKVVIIGADLRNPQLHKVLNVQRRNKKGVANYLVDEKILLDDIIEKGNQFDLNFDFVFSGTIPPNPAELLSNGRFDLLLNELKDKYDYLVVDTAPTLLVTDTTLISNLSDLVLYVVRSNETEKMLLDFINELTDLRKINNVGIVLNSVGQKQGYGYGYGYSYRYNYGYGYGYGLETKNNNKYLVFYKKIRSFFK